MDLAGKKCLVIGAARTGLAVSEFLLGKKAQVFLNDSQTKANLVWKKLVSLENRGVVLLLGQQPDLDSFSPDLIIVSPGVPLLLPCLQKARIKGIPIWSEIELAARFIKVPLLAVTGTNGKTTTTTLLGKILADGGRKVVVGGNIGEPLISKLEALNSDSLAVLEVSSFQLATTEIFRPQVALFLNLTPDHLDWHLSYEAYRESKEKIFLNQDSTDYLVLNYDDPETRKMAALAPGKVLFFSREHILETGFCVQDDWLVAKEASQTTRFLPVEEIKIKGGHNLENALAAAAAGWLMGLSKTSITMSLRTFPGVEHRLEEVLTYQGITFINDSKGTNPAAVIKALAAYTHPLILLAGGKNKGSDFSALALKIKERVKELILFGEAAPQIAAAVKKVGYRNYHLVSDLKAAVYLGTDLAVKGDIVLLSPACASWDMFSSFEERGQVFKDLVRKITESR
ncbi:MAG TPA: UDP-N-acetylmuramoyl-L-alanine--D-glutamate ligase [Clostridia bacterium]|jgi:UDP-N-acetylmuramoylalanine--D-glutamate ligase|nr:UDP-N-acetylmuramoyl-L-alanine--D-glutamate ligase [Clostridia bacterium]